MKRAFLILCISLCVFESKAAGTDSIQKKVDSYKKVKLTTDLKGVDREEIEGLKLLIEAAELTDQIFRIQAYAGNMAADTVTQASVRRFMDINYGPWDRLNNNIPFVPGVGPKPLGANFYPVDMRKTEFDSLPGQRSALHLRLFAF